MTSGTFFCPECHNAALWADADIAQTGSFCSQQCVRTFVEGQQPNAVEPDLQQVAEDGIDRSTWRHQQGEADFQAPLFT